MIIPNKLKKWDEIRIVALARSMSLVWEQNSRIAKEKLESYGFKVTFWKHVWEMDEFNSSKIESRIEDLHEAFSDAHVKGIFTVIWWYNTNQLLNYIDYQLIKNNPKILCGFSDITAIGNAITSKIGMLTYSGPHFSTWAMEKWFEHNLEYIEKCLMDEFPFEVKHSQTWSDDAWYMDQKNRNFIEDSEYWIMNEGEAKWKITGGHARCLACLQGTEFMPNLTDSILFLEEDAETNWPLFDRLIQSLIHQKDFSGVAGIVIWRFQKESHITREILTKIIKTKKELANLPVIANVDFWHTNPLITFPIWWSVEIKSNIKNPSIKIITH